METVTTWTWRSSGPLLPPAGTYDPEWISLKDPIVVRHDGRWHVWCTVRGRVRSHAVATTSFAAWPDAAAAEWRILDLGTQRVAAPQVFCFRPHRRWYLIGQARNEVWDPIRQAVFATNPDIADPAGWSPVAPLERRLGDAPIGLDFWVICDERSAHLFWTANNGQLGRAETGLADFPQAWGRPELALEADIFEASCTYRRREGGYLTGC